MLFSPPYIDEERIRELPIQSIGSNVLIASDAIIAGIQGLSVGSHVRIDSNTVLAIGRGSLSIGSYVHIGGCSHLNATSGIEIGDFATFSQGVRIYSASDDYSGESLTNPTVPIQYRNVSSAPVSVGPYSIIGSGSVVLPGVTIGEGAAVGALSLIRQDVPPWTIWAGSPARQVGLRSSKLLRLADAVRENSSDD